MSITDARSRSCGPPGQAEIDAAGTSAVLEEVRIRYLGRKAELPNLLRGVAALPPRGAR